MSDIPSVDTIIGRIESVQIDKGHEDHAKDPLHAVTGVIKNELSKLAFHNDIPKEKRDAVETAVVESLVAAGMEHGQAKTQAEEWLTPLKRFFRQ